MARRALARAMSAAGVAKRDEPYASQLGRAGDARIGAMRPPRLFSTRHGAATFRPLTYDASEEGDHRHADRPSQVVRCVRPGTGMRELDRDARATGARIGDADACRCPSCYRVARRTRTDADAAALRRSGLLLLRFREPSAHAAECAPGAGRRRVPPPARRRWCAPERTGSSAPV